MLKNYDNDKHAEVITYSSISPLPIITEQNNTDLNKFNSDQICRMCLSNTTEEQNISHLSSPVNIEGKTLSILDVFTSFTGFKYLLNDNMPKTICQRCLKHAKFVYKFKSQCEKSEIKLQQLLNMNICNSIKDDSLNISENENHSLNFSIEYEENFNISIDANKTHDKCKIKNNIPNNINYTVREKEILITSDIFKNNEFNESYTSNVDIQKKINQFSIVEQNIIPDNKQDIFITNSESDLTYKKSLLGMKNKTGLIAKRIFECSICGKNFKHRFQLKEHGRGHEDKKEFVCETCGKRFNRNKELMTHKRIHTGLKPHKCTICNKNFVGSDTLTKHKKTHTREKNYTCDYCTKSFITKDQLKVHIRKHTGEKPYLCNSEGCTKKFATVHSLNMHLPVHTNERPYSCLTCGKSFSRDQDKRKHETIHKRQDFPCPWTNCDQSCTSRLTLNKHLSTHCSEKQVLCTYCGKSFVRKADLKRHIYTHTQEKPFKCTQCGRGFNQRFGLTLHLKYHEGKTCFVCDLCGKGFIRKSTLEKHKLIHSGIKNYKCEYCSKAFTISAHLIRHRRTHTGERPYECKTCNKAFSSHSGYVVHLRSHTGEKPYQCKYCEKACATSSALKIHTRNHTGEKPYICSQCGMAFSRSDLRSLHLKMCFSDNRITENFYVEPKEISALSEATMINDNLNPQIGHNSNTMGQIKYADSENLQCQTTSASNIYGTTIISATSSNIQHSIINIPGTSKNITIISDQDFNNQIHH